MRLFRHQASSTLIDMTVNLERVSKNEAKRLRAAADRVQIVERRLGWRRIEGGVVSSGRQSSGIFKDGKILPGTHLYRGCGGQFLSSDVHCDVIDEDVVFLGVFHRCWGHCITDCLKHLWFVLGGLPNEFSGMRMVYCTYDCQEELPDNLFEMLSFLGIELNSAMRIDQPTRFRSVIIPDECFYVPESEDTLFRYMTPEFGLLIERLIDAVGVDRSGRPHRRVFFSTTRFHFWDYGAEDFDVAFNNAGYEVVFPERLHFAEMVRLLNETSIFASLDGSCAHNSIFLRKESQLIIVRKSREIFWHQHDINLLRNLSVTYVDAFIYASILLYEPNAPKRGPFFVWINSKMADVLGCKPTLPVLNIIKFLCWGITLHFGHKYGEWRRNRARHISMR